ncbi:ABC-2 type transport system ATP-binding protein [Actinomyces ruminicola]|uniref:ABC-2 type transport system ATP-binding protein n=1 Tax=Actinomyces ruminicola TaxID=332524 RepID=A0A1H0DX71_9ACTO|nr:ABC transporter ATP-binding protein [Actinomyces ruminicola]SDN74750.1 ABC-2 type transport system ATP-binding protein [Actinomyces ruminicola]
MLEVIDVQRRYRSGRGTGPLTLEVAAGEVLGVVGPNGAGKTTLFGALCGADDFQTGTVRLDGRELGRRLPAEACGFLPEQSRLFPQLTARQACRFEAAMRVLDLDDTALEEQLDRFGCADFRDTEVRHLSQGMTRRLGIACAFLGTPRVVVLDEPLNGLDVEGVLLFRRALADYLDSGGIALMSSHILSVLDEVCERMVLLKDGLVAATVDVREGGAERAYLEIFGH